MSRRGKGPRPPPDALRFVIQWLPKIRAIVRGVGVPADDVEDAVQVVLIAAWRAVQAGRLMAHPAAVMAWIQVVAPRIGAKAAVRRKRVVFLEGFDIVENEDDAELPALARDLLRELQAATTPERWRALLLRAEGLSLDEIAAEEHAPAATIHTRLRLAKRDLQAALSRERAREEGPAMPRRPQRRRRRKGR